MLKIGEVAKRSGTSVTTIRYYEMDGLIPKPVRSSQGYRTYPESVVKLLRFVQHAKSLGFSLKEISELIALKNRPDTNCSAMRKTALAKVTEIQEKIDALDKMKVALTPLIEQCQSSQPIHDCPILNALDDEPVSSSSSEL